MAVRRRRDPQHRAETPRVAIAQHGAVVERDVDVVVKGARWRLTPDPKRSRHAEVDEQCAVARVEQQILAATVDAVDQGALEALCEFAGNWPAQSPVVHVDPHDAPTDDMGRDTAPRRLYFRKFRH